MHTQTQVHAFSQLLRRYTSLNHLAQAARAVLQNSAQILQASLSSFSLCPSFVCRHFCHRLLSLHFFLFPSLSCYRWSTTSTESTSKAFKSRRLGSASAKTDPSKDSKKISSRRSKGNPRWPTGHFGWKALLTRSEGEPKCAFL